MPGIVAFVHKGFELQIFSLLWLCLNSSREVMVICQRAFTGTHSSSAGTLHLVKATILGTHSSFCLDLSVFVILQLNIAQLQMIHYCNEVFLFFGCLCERLRSIGLLSIETE
jgi:hypothetical protein